MPGRTYQRCPIEVSKIVNELIDDHYADLHEVSFGCLFAHAPIDEKTGEVKPPALVHHGLPAAAKVRVVSLKDRAKGIADVEILIDGDEWARWGDRRRRAVLDHELKHVNVRLLETEDGATAELKRDDLGRPKLCMIPHDVEIGAFADIATRWGEDSLDREQVRVAFDVHGQALMPWATERGTEAKAAVGQRKAVGRLEAGA